MRAVWPGAGRCPQAGAATTVTTAARTISNNLGGGAIFAVWVTATAVAAWIASSGSRWRDEALIAFAALIVIAVLWVWLLPIAAVCAAAWHLWGRGR